MLTFDERAVLHHVVPHPAAIKRRETKLLELRNEAGDEAGQQGKVIATRPETRRDETSEAGNDSGDSSHACTPTEALFELESDQVRTGSWTGPPRGERAPRVGISSTVFGVRT
jgi:hypothetical protein